MQPTRDRRSCQDWLPISTRLPGFQGRYSRALFEQGPYSYLFPGTSRAGSSRCLLSYNITPIYFVIDCIISFFLHVLKRSFSPRLSQSPANELPDFFLDSSTLLWKSEADISLVGVASVADGV